MKARDGTKFWEWFQSALSRLKLLDDEECAALVRNELTTIFPGICVEIGPGQSEEIRELIISANGDRFGMHLVKELVAQAPVCDGWSVTALRPARGFAFEFSFGNQCIDAAKLRFHPVQYENRPDEIGVRVFAPVLPVPEAEAEGAVAVIIETGIGEEFAANIDLLDIEFCQNAPPNSIGIEHLAEYLGSRLSNRN